MNKTEMKQSVVINEDSINRYVSEYTLSLKKTATAILTLADCVYRAKQELNADDYDEFCMRANVVKNSSYLKKLHCIAQKAARLNAVAANLPPNYTSLYALTQVKDDKYAEMLREKVINPSMTAAEINAYLDKHKVIEAPIITLTFKKDTDANMLARALDAVERICKQHGIRCTLSTELKTKLQGKVNALNDLKAAAVQRVSVNSAAIAIREAA